MDTATTAAPAKFIAPDTYTGTYTRRGIPAGFRVAHGTAAEIAAAMPTGVMWVSFGHLRCGREGFGRTRFVADSTGALHCYASNGNRVIIHPADRELRFLAK